MRPARLDVIDIELCAVGSAAPAEAAAPITLTQDPIAQLDPFLRGKEGA
jgi:hypothetical protein